VFYYKCYGEYTPEYGAVIDFFKHSYSTKRLTFYCQPFCKIGYENGQQGDRNREISVNGEIREVKLTNGDTGQKPVTCLKCVKIGEEKRVIQECNDIGAGSLL